MKTKIIGTLLLLAIDSTAQARTLSITRATDPGLNERVVFVVEAEVCPGSFPTVTQQISKLADKGAIVKLAVFSGNCTELTKTARFLIPADRDLEKIGLDPKTAEIFVQIQ